VSTAVSQAQRSATLTKLLTVGAGIGVVALAGLIATRPSPAAPVAAAHSARTAPDAVARTYSSVVTSIDARRPGEAAYIAGDIPRAVEQFERAVEADPRDPEALNNLGQVLVRSGRVPEAIPHFDRAIAIVPGKWSYHFNRARAFATMEEWPRAIEGYRDALRVFPDDYVTYFNLAKALQKSGDLRGAIEAFEHAIRLAPGEADFHLAHGVALEAAQRKGDAAAAYRKYLELAQAAPEADKVKARIALLEGGAPAAR
jgi:tetratricopeptide (TPR) repeat protein